MGGSEVVHLFGPEDPEPSGSAEVEMTMEGQMEKARMEGQWMRNGDFEAMILSKMMAGQ